MKIILSRKGFDGGSGGTPSPILPDGRMLSLPIPDEHSPITYRDINWDGYDLGAVVSSLTKGRISALDGAHLDPDLDENSLPRRDGWRPIFGQTGASQGHLRNQGVGEGDLFLFFGLFQNALVDGVHFQFNPDSTPKHVIWGWFQVESSTLVGGSDRKKLAWAAYHPHFNRPPEESNTIYFSQKRLEIPGLVTQSTAGAGVFSRFSSRLQLTAPGSNPSLWKLPRWMHPANEKPRLTYHRDLKRWEKESDHVLLKTVGRGQEFVLDCSHYPGAEKWLAELFDSERYT